MKKLLKTSIAAAVLCCAASLISIASAAQIVPADNGTWYAYPGQSTTYQAAIQQPINADGTSNFSGNGHAVIPVKFALSQGTGPFVFQSILSDGTDPNPNTTNDYSYLVFEPTTPPTLAEVTQLTANYTFTTGTCQGGSLRWTLYLNDPAFPGTNKTRNLDIHYQPGENGLGDQYCAPGTSGANMVQSTDTIVVINQFTYAGSPYTFQSSYNTTYADALSQLGGLQVLGMNLTVDSGWSPGGDQVVRLDSATVGVAVAGTTPYTETFTPQAQSPMTATCPTLPASMRMTKTSGANAGSVNEPVTVQPQDDNGVFRIVDCKYMYNLATGSLSGTGGYRVFATIDGTEFTVANFNLK